jgi:SAM-dependent methyltransferase
MDYWNNIYKNKKHLSIWPWSDIVSLVSRFCNKIINNKNSKVLELGCGAGANIPFFLSKKNQYFGIDKSEYIINFLKKKYKKKVILFYGDFENNKIFDKKYDLIFDRAALTHNKKNSIKQTIKLIHKSLKKNSIFIGVDWYSADTTYYNKNKKNFQKFNKGSFKNIGGVYFSTKLDMIKFFKDFDILMLQHKKVYNYSKSLKDPVKISSWTIVARKK